MTESIRRKLTQSATLLIGILLTLLAVVGHRFLPERRLTIDSSRQGANFFLAPYDNGAPSELKWIDQANFHYACRLPRATVNQGCGFAYMLSPAIASQGAAVGPTGQTLKSRVSGKSRPTSSRTRGSPAEGETKASQTSTPTANVAGQNFPQNDMV